MSSTPVPQALVSASQFLHLAPPPSQPFTSSHLRTLVLDYLTSSAFPDSAQAFAREVDARDRESEREGALVLERPRARPAGRSGAADGMEGVEATPPPQSLATWAEEEGGDGDAAMNGTGAHDEDEDEGEGEGDEDELDSARGLRSSNGNGKAVAFEDADHESAARTGATPAEHDDRDYPLLGLADLSAVRLRRDIREHILAGRIQSAVDLITDHFPSVLDPSIPPPIPTPTPSRSPRKAAAAAAAFAASPQQFFVSTPGASSSSSSPPASPLPPSSKRSPVPILGASFSPHALSLRPQILALNLQLQSFVELIRAANSTSRASTPTPSDMSGSSSSLASSAKSLGMGGMGRAIKQSQKLRGKADALPPGKERDAWEQECVDVAGLMAYTDLTICPVRGYLSQERRETLAELVNAAILQHGNRTPMPVVALVARQTSSIWQALAEWKHAFPPPEPGAAKLRSSAKTYPRFDLHTFLQEAESKS
ncbi:hypothetical protein RQP46_009266 [Phenoliferia psychrophenolica]